MALEGARDLVVGLSASASLATAQYTFMKMSGDFTVAQCASTIDCPVGILDNAPASGEAASVVFKGIAKIKLGTTVTAGQRVGTDAAGLAVPYTEGSDTTHYIAGQMLEGGSVNEIRSILLAGTPHRAS